MARIHAQLNNRLMEIDEVMNQNEESTASRKPLLEVLSKLGQPPSKEIMDLRDRVRFNHPSFPVFLFQTFLTLTSPFCSVPYSLWPYCWSSEVNPNDRHS